MYQSPYGNTQQPAANQNIIAPFPDWYTQHVGRQSGEIDGLILQTIKNTIDTVANRTNVFNVIGYSQPPMDFANELFARLRYLIAADATARHVRIADAASIIATDAIYSRIAGIASKAGPNAVAGLSQQIGVDLNSHNARATALINNNPNPLNALTAAYNSRIQQDRANAAPASNGVPTYNYGGNNTMSSDGEVKTGIAALMGNQNHYGNNGMNGYASSLFQEQPKAVTPDPNDDMYEDINDIEYIEYNRPDGTKGKRRRSRKAYAKLMAELSNAGVELTPANIATAEDRVAQGLSPITGLVIQPIDEAGAVGFNNDSQPKYAEPAKAPVTVGNTSLAHIIAKYDSERIYKSDEYDTFLKAFQAQMYAVAGCDEIHNDDDRATRVLDAAKSVIATIKNAVRNANKTGDIVYFDASGAVRREPNIAELYYRQRDDERAAAAEDARQQEMFRQGQASGVPEPARVPPGENINVGMRDAVENFTNVKIPTALKPKSQETMDIFQVDNSAMPTIDDAPPADLGADATDDFEDYFNPQEIVQPVDPLVEKLPEHLKDAGYDEIMDAAKDAGHKIEEPVLDIEMPWRNIPDSVRKELFRVARFVVPAYLRGHEELIMIRHGDDIRIEVRKIVKEEQHIIRNTVVCWDSEATSLDAGKRKLGALYGGKPVTSTDFIEVMNKNLQDVGLDEEDVVLAHVLETSPTVEIEDVLTVNGNSDDYQSEISTHLDSKGVVRKQTNTILESAVINFTRFATSFNPLSENTFDLVRQINEAVNAGEVISRVNLFRSECDHPIRDLTRTIKDFNRVLNYNLSVLLGAGLTVDDYNEDHESLTANALLTLGNELTDDEIADRIDECYLRTATACFSSVTVPGSVKDTQDELLGRLDIVSLLPIYYTQYPIYTDFNASRVNAETHPELVTLLKTIAPDNIESVIRIVTLDNVVLSFIAYNNDYYLVEVSE